MNGSRFRLGALVAGIIGVALSIVAALIDPAAFFPGWLAGFLFWIGLSLGALLLLMAHDLTGGRWGETARPPLEAAVAMMPLCALAALPLLGGLDRVYSWLSPATAAGLHNLSYLNLDFFLVRSGIYLVIWLVLAALTLRPLPPDAGSRTAARWSSPPGLILAGLSATFASFDWTMSLQPSWNSTIYGMMVTTAELEGALACATLFTIAALRPGGTGLNDLGSLLLAGIALWAYLAFMQFLIIWEEDLPDEITWYLDRIADGWLALTCLVAVFSVALPFFILVWWPLKRRPATLGIAAASLLLGYLFIDFWLVFPGLHIPLAWPTGPALVGIGGLWLALAQWRLERGHLLPLPFGPFAGGKHV